MCVCVCVCVCVCARTRTRVCVHSVVSDSAILWTVACQAHLSRYSPGKITGVVCLALLQRIFQTQGLNPCLLRLCIGRRILYHRSPKMVLMNLWIQSYSNNQWSMLKGTIPFLFCEKENGRKTHKYLSYTVEKKQGLWNFTEPGFKCHSITSCLNLQKLLNLFVPWFVLWNSDNNV